MKKKILLLSLIALVVLALGIGIWMLVAHLSDKKELEAQQQLVREYYENKYVTYQAENERYADYEVDVAFLGDSLTDGYDLAHYYPQYVTANRGIGGETSYGLKDRMQLSAYDLKPKVVVLLIGGNNLDTMLEDYEDILIGLRDNLPQTKVVVVSLTAMGQDWGHKNQIAAYNNVIIKKLADKYRYSFVDLYTPLMDLETGELYAAYTTDGAHFTAQGYEVVTAALTPAIDAALKGE